MLLALERGETRICRVVQVPTPTEEDAKRQHRERAVLVKEKTAHTNRIGGILMALGIRGVNPHRRDFVQRLDGLVTGTGEPLPAHTKQALAREHERITLTERQIKDIERAQASAIKAAATLQSAQEEGGATERGGAQAAALVRLKGKHPAKAAMWSGGSGSGFAQLPVPGEKLVQLGDRMIGDAAQDVGKPGLWIDAVEFCRSNEGVDCGSALTSPVGAGEQPCAAPESDAAQSALGGIVRQADTAILEKAGEGRPALEHV